MTRLATARELRTRAALEARIEELIALLDEVDGDTDREPSFGFLTVAGSDECEPDEDGEPSLGAFEASPMPPPGLWLLSRPAALSAELVRDPSTSQLAWSRGSLEDCEDDGDGEECDADAENWMQPVGL